MIRIRDGDSEAFEQLVVKYQPRLLRVLEHIVGRADLAEDLAQEVFLRVFRSREKYHAQAKFSTWLFTIANNLALNAMRNRRRRHEVNLPSIDSDPPDPRPIERLADNRGTTPSGPMRQRELAVIVRSALEQLNERQRMALLLHKFEEMNYAEIAKVMNLSPQAIKSLLNRARVSLRVSLEPYILIENPSANRSRSIGGVPEVP
jgi:RNA polymerase sigma-70 factor, ECF subfamily